MRAATALWAVCPLLAAATCGAQQFPYTAALNQRAAIYAEAGEKHAPAAQLEAGTSVEVYRRDGDWLAIRPPEGSFSWVQAADVESTPQPNVVRVSKPDATSFVGHAGSEQRTCWQIQLKQGELLQALDDVESLSPAPLWKRIAPPSGEFRYVHVKHVETSATPPVDSSVQLAGWTQRSDSSNAPSGASGAKPQAEASIAAIPSASVMPLSAVDPVTARLNQIEQQLTAMLAQPATTWNTLPLAAELHTLAATSPTPQLQARSQQLWAKVYRCQQIQQGYANVTTPAWPASYASAPQLNANASQYAAAQRPQGMLARFRQFAAGAQPAAAGASFQPPPTMQPPAVAPAVYQQPVYDSVTQQVTATQPAVTTASYAIGTGVATQAPIAAAANPQNYAAAGWLMPLVARSQMPRDARSGVPPYAITDDAGNVLALVTPAPGLNVTEYLRQPVGVIGPVGQLPNLANPHVVAQRVVVLSRHQ
jgi:hypothetical protein